jgi:hypothetical protein
MAILTFLGCVALLTMLGIAGWRVIVASGNQLFICWHRMTPFGRIVALLAVGVSVLYGGGKANDAARAISRSAHRGASATDSQMVARARNWNIRGAWDDSFDLTFADGFLYGRILPGTVSFEHLEVIEIPSAATDATGYYSQISKTNLWNHGAHGAGKWIQVAENNGFSDETIMEINDPPWLGGGSFTWPIPNAWRVKDSYAETNFFCMTNQRFVLDSDGTARMSKFGYVGIRLTNGVFTVMKE